MSISDGYNKKLEIERNSLFPQLSGLCYLDHAGTTPYSVEQLASVHKDLASQLYGNPHSNNLQGTATRDKIDQTRSLILHHFKTTEDDYSVVFTAGATAALKLVAECFNFTEPASNATHPKLQSTPPPQLVYLSSSAHTSVVGMREPCRARGVEILPLDYSASQLDELIKAGKASIVDSPPKEAPTANSLFVHPGQCNFSGRKYPLDMIPQIRGNSSLLPLATTSRWFVLVDASSWASTSHFDLGRFKPDFVSVSFYKMFGYPTGTGALIVKNTALPYLQKSYFGGGTIDMLLPRQMEVKFRCADTARLEDGTVNFLDIICLQYGFQTLKKIGNDMDSISRHVFSLRKLLTESLDDLKYPNGQSVIRIYQDHEGQPTSDNQGGILAFNVLQENGEVIGYSKVDRLADLYKVIVRTGDFCNLAAVQHHLEISDQAVLDNFHHGGHVSGDNRDVVDGRPTGAVRVSFGYSSVREDALRFVAMVRQCFLGESSDKEVVLPRERTCTRILGRWFNLFRFFSLSQDTKTPVTTPPCSPPQAVPKGLSTTALEDMSLEELLLRYSRPDVETFLAGHDPLASLETSNQEARIEALLIYPIKSCAAFVPPRGWPVVETGLLWDRGWLIAKWNSGSLSQKREQRLVTIRPFVDLERSLLIVHSERSVRGNLVLPLDSAKGEVSRAGILGQKFRVTDCGDDAADWLTDVLDQDDFRLFKQREDRECAFPKSKGKLTLAGESQFLFINTASVKWLADSLEEETGFCDFDLSDLCARFRPNVIISGIPALSEEKWKMFAINGVILKSFTNCVRCQIICRDQYSGESGREPLRTLNKLRPGESTFGIYVCIHKFSPGKEFTIGDILALV